MDNEMKGDTTGVKAKPLNPAKYRQMIKKQSAVTMPAGAMDNNRISQADFNNITNATNGRGYKPLPTSDKSKGQDNSYNRKNY